MSLLDEGTWSEEGPPESAIRRKSSRWDEVVKALKARPGEWLKFTGKSRNTPYSLRTRYPGLVVESANPHDANGSRRCDVWLLWPAADDGEASA